jgi:C4-type Zn-finger protein
VNWDDKDRGFPIDDKHQVEGIYLTCLACGHTVRMRWPDVLKTWGVGTYTRDIARSLRCTECGERKGNIMTYSDSRPRHSRDRIPDVSPYPWVGAFEWQRKLL